MWPAFSLCAVQHRVSLSLHHIVHPPHGCHHHHHRLVCCCCIFACLFGCLLNKMSQSISGIFHFSMANRDNTFDVVPAAAADVVFVVVVVIFVVAAVNVAPCASYFCGCQSVPVPVPIPVHGFPPVNFYTWYLPSAVASCRCTVLGDRLLVADPPSSARCSSCSAPHWLHVCKDNLIIAKCSIV